MPAPRPLPRPLTALAVDQRMIEGPAVDILRVIAGVALDLGLEAELDDVLRFVIVLYGRLGDLGYVTRQLDVEDGTR